MKIRNPSQADFRASLHSLIDQQSVAAFASWEQRGAKGEAVDLAFDFKHSTASPDLEYVEWNANDHPVQVGLVVLKRSLERFCNRSGHEERAAAPLRTSGVWLEHPKQAHHFTPSTQFSIRVSAHQYP